MKCQITKKDVKSRMGVISRAVTRINKSNFKYSHHDNIDVQLEVIEDEVKELRGNLKEC